MLLCLAVAARAPPRHESPLQPSACSTCGLSPMRGFANCCLKGGDWEGRCDHGEHSWEEGHLACRHAQHDTAQIEPAGHRNLTKRNSVKRGVAKGQGGQTRACTRCGSNGVGVPNCCSRGGAWEGKCSVSLSEGGKHTWSEGFNACLSVDNEAAPKNSPRNPATQRPGKQAAKQPTTKRPHSEPASKSGQSNRTAGSSCIDSEFGCCDGEEMAKESPEGSNCRWRLGTACSFTAHGCCPDLDIARTDHAGSSCADAAAVVPRAPPAPPPLSPPLFGDTGGCISLKEVMDVWFSAIAPISEADALALCVPATIIAAATTYDVVPEFGVFSQCPKSFNMAVTSARGLPLELSRPLCLLIPRAFSSSRSWAGRPSSRDSGRSGMDTIRTPGPRRASSTKCTPATTTTMAASPAGARPRAAARPSRASGKTRTPRPFRATVSAEASGRETRRSFCGQASPWVVRATSRSLARNAKERSGGIVIPVLVLVTVTVTGGAGGKGNRRPT